MKIYVILATKGRPHDIPIIIDLLLKQTARVEQIVVVGTGLEDFGVAADLHGNESFIHFEISKRPGLPIQRNVGIEKVLELHGEGDDFMVAYFDDDFRPALSWLEHARTALTDDNIVGMTGHVVADGINGPGIPEEDAKLYLEGKFDPLPHSSAERIGKVLDSAYGCNMAFSGAVTRKYRFDENLPAYGWQEDRDYTGQVNADGKVIGVGECKGVHLGTKAGRVSGVKFGYSQIANPLFLARKGTMSRGAAFKMTIYNLIANHLKAFFPEEWVDRKGRAKGNWLGLRDYIRGSIHPTNINKL